MLACMDGIKNYDTSHNLVAYFLEIMTDSLIIHSIDLSLRSCWLMVIFVLIAVIRFQRSRCIKTVMTERGEIYPSSFFSLNVFLLLSVSATRYLPPTSTVCCSFSSWFGHWFLLEYISVWFKFSWEMHDPAAACRHCLASTGIFLPFFYTLSVSLLTSCSLYFSLYFHLFFHLVCFPAIFFPFR